MIATTYFLKKGMETRTVVVTHFRPEEVQSLVIEGYHIVAIESDEV